MRNKLPELLEREVRVENIALNPYTLSLTVVGFEVEDDRGDRLLQVGRFAANLQVFPSVFGKPTLKYVELADTNSSVVLEKEGVLNFDRLLNLKGAEVADETVIANPEVSEGEVAVTLPKLRIDRIQLGNISLQFLDQTLANPFQHEFRLDQLTVLKLDTHPNEQAPLSVLGSFGEKGTFEINAELASVYPLDFKYALRMEGLDLSMVQPYLSEFAEVSLVGEMGLKFESELSYADGNFDARIRGDEILTVRDLALRDLTNDSEVLAVAEAKIEAFDFDLGESMLELKAVVRDPVVGIVRLEDGTVAVPELKLPATESITGESAATEAPSDSSFEGEVAIFPQVLKVHILGLDVENAKAVLREQSLEQPAEFVVQNINTTVGEVRHDLGADVQQGSVAFTLDLQLGDESGAVALAGALDLNTMKVGGSVSLDAIQLPWVQPYIAEYTNATLQSGQIDGAFELSALAQATPEFGVSGTMNLSGLQVVEMGSDKELLGFEELVISSVEATQDVVSIDEIKLTNPTGAIVLYENGESNLTRIIKTVEGSAQDADGVDVKVGIAVPEGDVGEESAAMVEIPSVHLGRFVMEGGKVDFTDESSKPHFQTTVSDIDVLVTPIDLDPTVKSELSVSAWIDHTAEVMCKGTSHLLDVEKDTQMDFSLAAFNLSSATSYSQAFIARKIDKGHLSVASQLEIEAGQLVVKNDLEVDSLNLGDKVENPDAVSLPLDLAIAILQDSNGVIRQSIPVKGDLTQPGVGIGSIILSATVTAIRNTIVKVAMSPFSILSGLVGGDEDMDRLEFGSGSIEVSETNHKRLSDLASVLQERPKLKLEILSSYDAASERASLREKLLYLALEHYRGGAWIYDTAAVASMDPLLLEQPTQTQLMDRLTTALAHGLTFLEAPDSAEILESHTVETNGPASVLASGSVEDGADTEQETKTETEERGFVGKLLHRVVSVFVGDESEQISEEASVESETSVAVDGVKNETLEAGAIPSETVAATPEDLEKALSLIPDEAVSIDWVEQLALERIKKVSEILVQELGVSSERVFSNHNPVPGAATEVTFELAN